MTANVRRSLAFFAGGAVLGLVIAGYGLFTARGTRLRIVPAEDLALVNGHPILRSDFATQVQTQFATPFERSTAVQRRQVLEDMISEEILVQRGLEIDLPSFDPDVRAALVAGVELEVSADVLAQQPQESELRAYYQSHRGDYASEGVMRLRVLTAASPGATTAADAMPGAVQALRNHLPLDEVAKRYALTDAKYLMSRSHPDVGAIFEFAARAKLPPAIYAAASVLAAGEVSNPILEGGATYVVVMLERHVPVPLDYPAAADRVWVDYKKEAQRRVRDANARYLRKRAAVLFSDDASNLEEGGG